MIPIMVLACVWCQLRRGECLGLQRPEIHWHDDGSATLHVRRHFNANTARCRTRRAMLASALSVPRIMVQRLKGHLRDNVAPEAKAPVVPSSIRGSEPLSHTKWGHLWVDARDAVKSVPPASGSTTSDTRWLTLFAQEGTTLAELMRRGGHADIRVVIRYQHSTMTRDRELANRMTKTAAAGDGSRTKPSSVAPGRGIGSER